MSAAEKIVRLLESEEDHLDDIKRLIRAAELQSLESYHIRKSNFNLLQFCIYANHPEVIRLLFARGLFKNIDYLCTKPIHLASRLGRFGALQILLWELPYDYRTQSCLCLLTSGTHNEDANQDTAIELAAEQGHQRVVQFYVDRFCLANTRVAHALEAVVDMDAPKALQYLLSNSSFSEKIQKETLKRAILKKRPNCLDYLLQREIHPPSNEYNLLFLHSDGFSDDLSNPYKGVYETASILLKHHLDPNCSVPIGSYPLYSLLESLLNSVNIPGNERPKEHLRTLRLMLTSGADPDFDELGYSIAQPDVATVFGREPWYSALHSFFVQINSTEARHCVDVLEVLLAYGANPYNESPESGLLPITALFRSRVLVHTGPAFNLSTVRRYLQLYSRLLSPAHFRHSLALIRDSCFSLWQIKSQPTIQNNSKPFDDEDDMDESFVLSTWVEIFDPASYMSTPFSLQHICKLTIWSHTGWKRQAVLRVTRSTVLKNYLSNPLD